MCTSAPSGTAASRSAAIFTRRWDRHPMPSEEFLLYQRAYCLHRLMRGKHHHALDYQGWPLRVTTPLLSLQLALASCLGTLQCINIYINLFGFMIFNAMYTARSCPHTYLISRFHTNQQTKLTQRQLLNMAQSEHTALVQIQFVSEPSAHGDNNTIDRRLLDIDYTHSKCVELRQ